MHEVARTVMLRLPAPWGVDLSVTNEVFLLWVAGGLSFALLFLASRRRSLVPHGAFRNLFEGLVQFIEKEIVTESVGAEGRRWAPFLLTLFFFILFSNLLGLVPVPGVFRSATSNLNVTAALALLVFVLTVAISIRRCGLRGFLRRFLPAGVPWWLGLAVAPIEVISWLARPFSLAIRLFANMMAGHVLIFVFIGMAAAAARVLKPVSVAGALAGAVAMELFELFGCVIQAFIFTMLAGIYIREALETDKPASARLAQTAAGT